MSHNMSDELDLEAQKQRMKEWFFARYVNPIEECPHESAEGGYIYIWGGPFDAREELYNEFENDIPENLIEEVVTELEQDCIEWSARPEIQDTSFFDELFEKDFKALNTLQDAVENIRRLLNLKSTIPGDLQNIYDRLLFANGITALETYLSDTFMLKVNYDDSLLQRFIETNPRYRKRLENFNTHKNFEALERITERAKKDLDNTVWHRLNDIHVIYRGTLGVVFDCKLLGTLNDHIKTRHDIVHRNGKTNYGREVICSPDSLIETVENFVELIEKQLMG